MKIAIGLVDRGHAIVAGITIVLVGMVQRATSRRVVLQLPALQEMSIDLT